MDSARDFDLLGESVPQVRVSARTLALSGFFFCNIIYIYIYINCFRVESKLITTRRIADNLDSEAFHSITFQTDTWRKMQ